MHLSLISEIATASAAVVTACAAVIGTIKAIPFFKSQSELSRQLTTVTVQRDEARDAANAYKLSSEGWQARVDELSERVKSVGDEVHELRTQLATAILYIADIFEAERNNSPRPSIPESLRPLLAEVVRKMAEQKLLADATSSITEHLD